MKAVVSESVCLSLSLFPLFFVSVRVPETDVTQRSPESSVRVSREARDARLFCTVFAIALTVPTLPTTTVYVMYRTLSSIGGACATFCGPAYRHGQ
jgi:hypothetical protein